MTTQASSKVIRSDDFEFKKIGRLSRTREIVNFISSEFAAESSLHMCFIMFPEFARLYLSWLFTIGATVYGMYRKALIMHGKFGKLDSQKLIDEQLVGVFAIAQYERDDPIYRRALDALRKKCYEHLRAITFSRHVKLIGEEEKQFLVDLFFAQAVWPDHQFDLIHRGHSHEDIKVDRIYMVPMLVAEWGENQSGYIRVLLHEALIKAMDLNTKHLKEGVGYSYPTARVVVPSDVSVISTISGLEFPTQLDTDLAQAPSWYKLGQVKLTTARAIRRSYYASDI